MRHLGKTAVFMLVAAIVAFGQYDKDKPDLMLKRPSEATYLGDDKYNSTAIGQTMTQNADAGDTVIYHFRVQNDGEAMEPGYPYSDDIKVKANAGKDGWEVTYYNTISGGSDITDEITKTGWTTGPLKAGAFKQIRAVVVIPDNASENDTFIVDMIAHSGNKPEIVDRVKGIVVVGKGGGPGPGTVETDDRTAFYLETTASYSNISFGLPSSENVCINIYDATGRIIEQVLNEKLSAGAHTVTWNSANLPNGLYFVRLLTPTHTATSTVVLVK